MKKYKCSVCEWIYDPAIGDPDGGIAPGTAFEDIPEDSGASFAARRGHVDGHGILQGVDDHEARRAAAGLSPAALEHWRQGRRRRDADPGGRAPAHAVRRFLPRAARLRRPPVRGKIRKHPHTERPYRRISKNWQPQPGLPVLYYVERYFFRA